VLDRQPAFLLRLIRFNRNDARVALDVPGPRPLLRGLLAAGRR
jgi:hypothetical protein